MDAKNSLGSTSHGSIGGVVGMNLKMIYLGFQWLVGIILRLVGWMWFDWVFLKGCFFFFWIGEGRTFNYWMILGLFFW